MPANQWSPWELSLVRANVTMDPAILAEKIRAETGIVRTPKGVYQMQRRVFKGTDPGTGKTEASADFDTRPSGWYEETLGVLLLSYPDVMRVWAHYHRYVEVEYVKTMRQGWVTVRCRRDADAP